MDELELREAACRAVSAFAGDIDEGARHLNRCLPDPPPNVREVVEHEAMKLAKIASKTLRKRFGKGAAAECDRLARDFPVMEKHWHRVGKILRDEDSGSE